MMGGETTPTEISSTYLSVPPTNKLEWERFFGEHMGLFTGLARKISPDCQRADRDDADQEALLGAFLAGQGFDASRGARFTTYARARANYAVRELFRAASTAAPTPVDRLEKKAPSEEPRNESDERIGAVREFVDGLEGLDRRLIQLRYFENLSLQQTAYVLKISKTAVFKREARILEAGRVRLAAWRED